VRSARLRREDNFTYHKVVKLRNAESKNVPQTQLLCPNQGKRMSKTLLKCPICHQRLRHRRANKRKISDRPKEHIVTLTYFPRGKAWKLGRGISAYDIAGHMRFYVECVEQLRPRLCDQITRDVFHHFLRRKQPISGVE